jgi:hypothetical protein
MTQKHTPKITGSDDKGWNVTDGISSGNGSSPQAALDAYREDRAFNESHCDLQYWKKCAERASARCTILSAKNDELLDELKLWVECMEGYKSLGNVLTLAMDERLQFTKQLVAKARGEV